MADTLIAVVAALLIGHLAPTLAGSLRHYDWYRDWLHWLDARFPEGSAWRARWGIAIALSLPLLAVGLFQIALHEPLYGLAGLVFGVAVLFYTWGPRDLDLDVDAITQATDPTTRREAAARLWTDGSVSLEGGALVEAVFRNAQRRWFGVLFWFLVLGPLGALLYRLTVLSADGEYVRTLPSETAQGARTLLAVLDWPVAQLMALALALVGNFDTVLGAWRENGGASFALNSNFLSAIARASVKVELAEEAADAASELGEAGVTTVPPPVIVPTGDMPELRDAISLVWRSLLVWLAVLALFVIAGWVS